MPKNEVTFQDCYARWDDGALVIGNTRITRQFALRPGKLTTTALSIPDGLSFAATGSPESKITTQDEVFDLGADNSFSGTRISAEIERSPFREDSLHVAVEFTGCDGLAARKHFRLWPGVAAIRANLDLQSESDLSNLDYTRPDSLALAWAGADAVIRAVELRDLSDYTCEFTTERDYTQITDEPQRLVGNVVMVRSGKGGLFCYKESPVTNAQLYPLYYDYLVSAKSLEMVGSGFHNLPAGKSRTTYSSIIGVFEGDWDDATLAFKEYQRARYKMDPERDYFIISNSWGDFKEDISAQKILGELEVAADLGLTDVEIDAGWTNNVMGDEPNETRFPDGFEPIIKRAAELGIRMGIWTIPTRLANSLQILKEHPDWVARSNNHTPCDVQASYYNSILVGVELCHPDCFHYMKDYYKRLYNRGFRRFKSDTFQLDGFNSLLGDLYDHYEALRRLQEELVLECPGLTFDQDVTRTNRPTYDFGLDYGTIFLENRYQRGDVSNNGNYKPYKTLSSLWQVAQYIPAQKLQMEISNDEPGFSASYLLACVMFSNPLFWESLARISEGARRELKPLIKLYKQHQAGIFAGHIVRLGEKPSGTAWTGLQSHQPENGSGYTIIFREDNPAATCRFFPKYLKKPTRFESLTDDSRTITLENPVEGTEITLEKPFSFRLYRYS